jgi:hypothetical protein
VLDLVPRQPACCAGWTGELVRGSDRVTSADHPLGHDPGVEAPAMCEPPPDPGRGEALEVATRLTQPDPLEDHIPDPKLTSDEVVQRHSARHDVAPAVAELEFDPVVADKGLDRLGLDEGDLATGILFVGELARMVVIAIALEASARDRSNLVDGHRGIALVGSDVNRQNLPHEHSPRLSDTRGV